MKSLFRFVDWPLRVKMAALLALVSLLPLMVTAWLDLREASVRLLQDTEEHLQVHAGQLAREIDAIHGRNRQMAVGLARLPDVLAYCRTAAPERAARAATARELLRLQELSDSAVSGAALLDADGSLLLSSGPELRPPGPLALAPLRTASNGNAAIGEVFAGRASPPEPVVAYFAPVLKADGTVACVAAIWVQTTAISDVLRPAGGRPGAMTVPGGHALLFDALGIQVAPASDSAALFHPSGALASGAAAALLGQARFGERTGTLLRTPLDYPGVHEHAVASSPDGAIFASIDPVGQRAVFAVARRLDSVPWTVFTFFPRAKFEAEIDRQRRQKALIALVAMTVSATLGVLFSRHLGAPLTALVQATRHIASGDQGVRLRERRGDEFGELARSIESMAERVRAQTEGLEHARAVLDERVRERTTELEAEISERRIAQAAIRQSQALLQAIVDNTASMISVKDLDGRYLLANRRFCEVYRTSSAALLGRTGPEPLPRESAQAPLSAGRRVAIAGETVVSEEAALLDDGVHTYVSVKCPLRDDQGRTCGVIDISTDITERKTMESNLHSQLARLQLLDQITTAIAAQHQLASVYRVVLHHLEARMPVDFGCVCLVDGLQEQLVVARVGVQSRGLAERLGLQENGRLEVGARELARVSRGAQLGAQAQGSVDSPLAARLAEVGLASQVIAPLQSEGRMFGVLVVARKRAQAFGNEDREFLRQLGAHVALAARQMQLHVALKQAYDDLRQTQQSVMHQERLRALGQMASGIAHDINNAISPVALYAESLLESEQLLSARGRRHLGTISRAIDDVAATVARMREFYRQRNEPQAMTPVRLDTLVQQVVDLTQARWSDMPQQRGIVIGLKTEFAPDLPPVLGVESELREALINVVLNAVDAMPEGGTLALRTRCAVMLDAAEQETRRVCVDIADTGIGMGANTRLHCLEPFFTTKGERGTGLGLAMVYGAMQRHHGDVEIESEPGSGTTVTLVFPMPPAAPAAPMPIVADHAPASPLEILLIDDDPVMLGSIGETLGSDGHLIVSASGGQSGIDLFGQHLRERPFDLVITDLGMPYVDGRKVASEIKARSESTPVIMLTGWGERMLATGDIPAHVDLLLGKPVRLQDLRAALSRLTTRHSSAVELSKEEP